LGSYSGQGRILHDRRDALLVRRNLATTVDAFIEKKLTA
jgi:hypothetical protein